MADTNFVNNVTLTDADWFNDVNRLNYTIFGDPANIAAVVTAIYASTALRFRVGTFLKDTSDASGVQAFTGVGFKPRAIIFLMNANATTLMSIGVDDSALAVGMSDVGSFLPGAWGNVGSNSIQSTPSGSNVYQGKISTLDVDGFTMQWIRTGAPTEVITVNYLALR